MDDIAKAHHAKWPQTKRVEYHKVHPGRFAGPDLSFPIEDAEDVQHAVHLYGQGDHPEAIKRKIISIARDMGLKHALPAAWMDPGDDGQASDGHVQEAVFSVEGQILEGQTLDRQGHEVRVTVIQGGQSKNGFIYDQDALQQLARMIEGAQAYADHDTNVPVRSVRDIIGFYKNAIYIPPDTTNQPGRVDATLHILEAASWLWSIIYEACSIGKPELIGLSVDIFGKWQQSADSSQARYVTGISQINSCDIVTRASAGGAFQRILHAQQQQLEIRPGNEASASSYAQPGRNEVSQGEPMDPENEQNNTPPENTPPVVPPAAPATPPVTPPVEPTSASRIPEAAPSMVGVPLAGTLATPPAIPPAAPAVPEEVMAIIQQLQLQAAQATLERRLTESILPSAVIAPIRERYAERIFEMADLERDLTASQAMMAALASSGVIRDHGYARPEIGEQITEAEKVQAAFDLMFKDGPGGTLDIDPRFTGIRPFGSIREAYVRATGDGEISGASNRDLGRIRIGESAPVGRITEADTTTASFAFLLGTSMNKRLLKDYQAWPAEWQRFCTVVPIKDFKQA